MTNAFILCDLIWKVQKSDAANREGSFNVIMHIPICNVINEMMNINHYTQIIIDVPSVECDNDNILLDQLNSKTLC